MTIYEMFHVSPKEVKSLFIFTVLFFLAALGTLLAWKIYNLRRFGKLNRRKEPLPASDEEMLDLELMEPEMYYQLKTQKMIILEVSPIKELKSIRNDQSNGNDQSIDFSLQDFYQRLSKRKNKSESKQ